MADMPYVLALLREREGYARDSRRHHRVIEVDDELGKQGFGVDSKGALVKLAKVEKAEPEKAEPVKRPVREHAVSKAPERAVDKD